MAYVRRPRFLHYSSSEKKICDEMLLQDYVQWLKHKKSDNPKYTAKCNKQHLNEQVWKINEHAMEDHAHWTTPLDNLSVVY